MADDLKRVGLVFKADGTVDFRKNLKDVNAVIQDNRSEFKLAKAAWEDSTSSLEKLGDQQEYLTKQTKTYSEKVEVLKKEIEELENAENKDESALKKKKSQLTSTQATLINYQKGLKDVTHQIESGSAVMRDEMKVLDDSMSTLDSRAKENESSFKNLQAQWDKNTKSSAKLKDEQKYLSTQSDIYTEKVEALSEQLEILEYSEERNEKAIYDKRTELNNAKASLNGYKGRLEEVNRELGFGVEKLEKYGESLKKAGSKINEIGSGLTNHITKPALAAGAAVGGIALAKGWSRMTEIDNAKVKLKAIGNSAEDVSAIMENATKSVKGTAYGLNDAATAAASAVASGVEPGEKLERYLKNVADAAAVAGIGMDEMGNIFGKVTTTGKATNESLQQLAERGIPVYQWLADAAGTTSDAIFDMASDGEISLSMLQDAVEKNIGGAAQTIGSETIKGAMANLGASISRIGANFLGSADDADSFAGKILPLLNDLTGGLGNVEEKAKQWGATFGNVFGAVIEYVRSGGESFGELSGTAQEIFETLQPIIDAVMIMAELFNSLSPEMKTAFVVGLITAGPLVKIVGTLTTGVGGLFNIVSKVAGFLFGNAPGVLNTMSTIGVGAKALFGIIAAHPIIAIITVVIATLVTLYTKCEWFRDGVNSAFQTIYDVVTGAWKGIKKAWDGAVDFFSGIQKGIQKAIGVITGDSKKNKINVKSSVETKSLLKTGVEWFASGGILNRPTVFGQRKNGNLLAGGESGAEAVLPISLLKQYIAEENAASNAQLVEAFKEVFEGMIIQNDNRTYIGDREFYNTVSDAVTKRIDRKQSDKGILRGKLA